MYLNANHTIYVKNLCTKVKKPELRRSLYSYFSTYGRILDIVALKTKRERGQAFIVFAEPNSASAALRDCNGRLMYDKPMVIEFAKSKSRVIAMMDGTWEQQLLQRQQQQQPPPPPSLQFNLTKPITTISMKRGREESEEPIEQETEIMKKPKMNTDHDLSEIEIGEPHPVLFVKNLPTTLPVEEIESLFSKYPGYKEFRHVPGKSDLAFIEFDSIEHSRSAQTSLHGMVLEDHTLIVIFSKQRT